MFKEEDFQKFFQEFNNVGGQSTIQTLYNIMPSLTDEQVIIVNDCIFFATKWNIPELQEYIENVVRFKQKNRSLGFLPSFKKFLASNTLEEKFRGYKLTPGQGDDQ